MGYNRRMPDLDPGTILVIVLRVAVPLTILRYPLGGFIISLALDGLHMPIAYLTNDLFKVSEESLVARQYYHLTDKWLDVYFLSLAAIVSRKWETRGFRAASFFLLFLRIVGVIMFYITGNRVMLFFFPNVYEYFYLYSATVRKWAPRLFPNSFGKLGIVVFIASALKLFGEYFQHVRGLGVGEIITLLTPFELPYPTLWESVLSLFQKR